MQPMAAVMIGTSLGILGLIAFLSGIIAMAYSERVLLLLAAHAALGLGQVGAMPVYPLWALDAVWVQVFTLLQFGLLAWLSMRVIADPRRRRRIRWSLQALAGACVLAALAAWARVLPERAGPGLMAALVLLSLWALRHSWGTLGRWKWWFVAGQAVYVGSCTLAHGPGHSEWANQWLPVLGITLQVPMIYLALVWRSRLANEAGLRLAAMASTDPLTGLVTPKIMTDRLEGAVRRSRRFGYPSAVFLVELANLPQIARQHGEQASEAALVLAANCLRERLQEVDVAARMGPGRFAILVEGLSQPDTAALLATGIVAHGLMAQGFVAPAVKLDFLISHSVLPASTQELPALLEALQRSLHDMASQGGRKITDLQRAAQPLHLSPVPAGAGSEPGPKASPAAL